MRKITSLFALLLMFITGTVCAGAASYTITFNHASGTFYKDGTTQITSVWGNKWVSNEAGKPVVTLTASANNINAENGRMAPGSSTSCTYTLSVEKGYIVTGFSMNCPTFGAEVTVTPAGESAVVVASGGTLVVNSSASSFVYSGSNSGRIKASAGDGGSFTITVEDDPWAPSITGAYLTVGEKVSSFSTVSDPTDNTKWYVLTQVRGGETPMYNAGTGTRLKRAGTSVTTASLNGLASDFAQYLIRFVDAGSEGIYNIQFADGDWIDNSLNTTSSKNGAGSYAFYNCNGGNGCYFAWNLNSKSGSRVDNNAAGYTVSFWDAGEVSGTSGNNVWYLYKTEVKVPASTVDVTYNFVVGGNIVNTEVVTVPANSAVSIPAGLTAGYSSDYYTFNTTGTIGSDNCTITITATLNNASIVYPYTNISNAKSYYVKTRNNARGGLSTYTDASDTYLAISIKDGLNVSPKKFAFISYENNYYLYSVEDQMFVTFDGSNDKKALLASTVTGTTDRVAFSQTVAPLYEIRFDGNNSKIFNGSNSASYPYGMIFNSWGSSSNQWDDGCQYTIEEAGDFDPTSALAALDAFFNPATSVVYQISDANGVVYTSASAPATAGDEITTLPDTYKKDYCTYTVTPTTIVAGANTVPVTVTYALPFNTSENFSTAKWYLAKIRTSYYVKMDTTEPYYPTSTKSYDDNYQWAFVGNPYDGFTILNKAAGDGYGLTKDGDYAVMRNSGVDTWELVKNGDDGFNLLRVGSDMDYLNQAGGSSGHLGFWVSTSGRTDNGGKILLEEILDNYYAQVKAEVYPFLFADVDNPLGGGAAASIDNAFGISSADATTIAGTYATNILNNTYSISEYLGIKSAVEAAIAYPADGFYRVKNVSTGKYLRAINTSRGGVVVDLDATAAASDAASVIEVRTVEGQQYLLSNGGWLNWVYGNYSGYEGYVATTKDKYVHWLCTTPGQGAFAIVYGNGEGAYVGYIPTSYYTVNTSNETTYGTDGTSDAAQWVFEPATTVNVGLHAADDNKAYATFYAPFDATFTGGVTAYTITRGAAIDGVGSEAVMTAVSGAVPAGTPVVLVDETGTVAAATANVSYGAAALGVENILSGHYLASTVADGSLVFGQANSTPGFYRYYDYTTVLGANRAFIAPAQANNVRAIVFTGGVATGINAATFNANGNAYDLQGRRVQNAQKGLYILNGKKVLVK